MDWMLMPYRRYAEFAGRSQRKEYWMFVLFQIIVMIVPYILLFAGAPAVDPMTGETMGSPGVLFYLAFIIIIVFALVTIIPSIAVIVRRLHDTDHSGWWYWIQLIPLVGPIIMLVFLCSDGTPGPNRFGPDPKGRSDAEVFS